jgi:hypothetical protein
MGDRQLDLCSCLAYEMQLMSIDWLCCVEASEHRVNNYGLAADISEHRLTPTASQQTSASTG